MELLRKENWRKEENREVVHLAESRTRPCRIAFAADFEWWYGTLILEKSLPCHRD